MTPTDELLALSQDWPEIEVEAGADVLVEGDATRRLYLLVEGSLEVRRGEEVVARLDTPGTCVGEISLLLDHVHHATIVATAPSRLRVLDDAHEVLLQDAAILAPVASILASRLRLVTTYLADLRTQYGESQPGLGMVSDVLGSLTRHSGTSLEPGSEREPDVPY
jgi:CRP/FNR family cyclic AMP-dependent transcriptional regulator